MNAPSNDLETLRELEARHDELLLRLDELDKRIEQVLTACVRPQTAEGGPENESREEETGWANLKAA